MKKCPFRKDTWVMDFQWEGNYPLPAHTQEDFQECIGEECMAYYTYSAKPYWDAQYEKDYDGCKLMKKE